MKNSYKAFTLAEIMIVLAVIGVLTAVLLPTARNSMPDETVMKFKKAHKTFYTAIRELTHSDKYYFEGNLGVMPSEAAVTSSTYFCQTLADILTVKSVACSSSTSTSNATKSGALSTMSTALDSACKSQAATIGAEITLYDGTVFYQTSPKTHFGSSTFATKDSNGLLSTYKVICIDIDGIPSGASSSDCKNECPFGYGVRADGKIVNGARAQEWFDMSIHQTD